MLVQKNFSIQDKIVAKLSEWPKDTLHNKVIHFTLFDNLFLGDF